MCQKVEAVGDSVYRQLETRAAKRHTRTRPPPQRHLPTHRHLPPHRHLRTARAHGARQTLAPSCSETKERGERREERGERKGERSGDTRMCHVSRAVMGNGWLCLGKAAFNGVFV